MSTTAATSGPRPTVAISGSSGLLGGALATFLVGRGWRIVRLVREQSKKAAEGSREDPGAALLWSVERGILEPERLAGPQRLDAVVHLAGENIAGGRWTAGRKQRLYQSRVPATAALVSSLSRAPEPPSIFVCASAAGYYGDRDDERLDESAHEGEGFLADLCADWERAAGDARAWGARVAQLRLGVVLDRRGGALQRMLPIFRLGLGGKLGSGDQYFPWIALADACSAIERILEDRALEGPINLCAPEAATNADFTRALSRVLRRPALIPAPAVALRTVLGAMADETLLASAYLVPDKLETAGFTFRYPQLEEALRAALGD